MTDRELTSENFACGIRRSVRELLMAGNIRGGDDIVAVRRFVDLTQEAVAAAQGISVHTLRTWEQDRRHPKVREEPVTFGQENLDSQKTWVETSDSMKETENPPREPLHGHDLIVARSRALHRAVAEKIRSDKALIEVARGNVNRWIAQEERRGRVSPALLEWKKWMEERTVEETLDLICEESEEADRLRHATPFCGILTEEERNAIYRRHATVPA